MIEIDGKIVSIDLLTEYFSCDISKCKGICCVEGNSGAPLEPYEVRLLKEGYNAYKPYLKPEGINAIEQQGFVVVDEDGDLTTPLINNAECAYSFEENGMTFCSIERAWREGKLNFQKPISCHLYPIRVTKFSNGTYGLNYHRWNVCSSAVVCGKREQIPVYKSLKSPIERHFGLEFYNALEEAEKFIKNNNNPED